MRTLKTLVLPLLLIASMIGFDSLRLAGERLLGAVAGVAVFDRR
ncbi:hypothetical protein [Aquipseudomonas alcaligenes]|nr:hypothetical protein [Pseudomonas alcaligenes]